MKDALLALASRRTSKAIENAQRQLDLLHSAMNTASALEKSLDINFCTDLSDFHVILSAESRLPNETYIGALEIAVLAEHQHKSYVNQVISAFEHAISLLVDDEKRINDVVANVDRKYRNNKDAVVRKSEEKTNQRRSCILEEAKGHSVGATLACFISFVVFALLAYKFAPDNYLAASGIFSVLLALAVGGAVNWALVNSTNRSLADLTAESKSSLDSTICDLKRDYEQTVAGLKNDLAQIQARCRLLGDKLDEYRLHYA